MTIQMKAITKYFHAVLFILPYQVVLFFKRVDETLVSDHSNIRYRVLLFSGAAVYYAAQVGFSFLDILHNGLGLFALQCSRNNYH